MCDLFDHFTVHPQNLGLNEENWLVFLNAAIFILTRVKFFIFELTIVTKSCCSLILTVKALVQLLNYTIVLLFLGAYLTSFVILPNLDLLSACVAHGILIIINGHKMGVRALMRLCEQIKFIVMAKNNFAEVMRDLNVHVFGVVLLLDDDGLLVLVNSLLVFFYVKNHDRIGLS